MPAIKVWMRRLAAVSAALLVLLGGQAVSRSEDSVTIEGEVEVAEYDEETGRPTSVSIWDSEWGSVLVLNEGKGRELLKHVGEVAKVTGVISELDDDGSYSYAIDVSSYSIENAGEPDDDAEDEPDWDPDPEK